RGNGGAPFLEAKWRWPTVPDKVEDVPVKGWLDKILDPALKSLGDQQLPVVPAAFPIAAGGKLIFRGFDTIHALDLKTGELAWSARGIHGFGYLASDPGRKQTVDRWLNEFYLRDSPQTIFENSTIGTLSTDNQRVYAVDDIALTPHPNIQQFPGGFNGEVN